MGDYMEIYTVSFFGHRKITDSIEIEKRLDKLVRELIRTKEYVEFLVGRNGEFDTIVSSLIRIAIAELDYGNASHILVLPYETAEFRNNTDSYKNYYTEVEICEQAAVAHFRAAIQVRNKTMVDRSDLVVCCIEHTSGGAYKTVQYAQNQQKDIINLNFN